MYHKKWTTSNILSLAVAPTCKSKFQTGLDFRSIIYNILKILSSKIKFSIDIEVKESVALYNVIPT